jgi:hypothetical protein
LLSFRYSKLLSIIVTRNETHANTMVREISGLSIEDQSLSPDSSIISSTPIVDKQRRKRRKACLTTQGSKRRNLAGNERQREQKQEKRGNESLEERSLRLQHMSEHAAYMRANETDAERSLRLQDKSEHAAYMRAKETIEEREVRLALRRQRDYDRQFQSLTYRLADIPRRAMYDPDFRPHYLGPMNNRCQFCSALFYVSEGTISKGQLVYNKCCHGGKLANLPVTKQYHQVLINLLQPLPIYNIERKHFLENIRQYNTLLAFGGVQTNFDRSNWDNRYNNRYRPFIYKCHGNMYFNVPPLFNEPNCQYKPQTAQFYVMDADIANNQRIGAWRNDNCLINNQVINLFELLF